MEHPMARKPGAGDGVPETLPESPAQAIRAGLEEAVEIAAGRRKPARTIRIPRPLPDPDPAAIRAGLGLTQPEFAEEFALNVTTVRNWEQAHTDLSAAVRTLYTIIQHEPTAARRALRKARAAGAGAAAD